MLGEQLRYQILEALYEAPLEPSRWEEFLRLTARAAQGEAATLITHDYGHTESDMATQWGCNPEMPQLYAAHFGAVDVWREAVTASADWLGISEQFVPSQSLAKTEIYNDFLVPFQIPHGIFAMIARSRARVVNLSILRGSNLGPFETTDLEIVKFLRPHIQRAYRLHSELSGLHQQNASLMAALDALPTGIIFVGPKLEIVATNRAAQSLLSANNGLCARRGALSAQHVGESARLQQLIQETVTTSEGMGMSSGGAVTISRRALPPLYVLVSPVHGLDIDESHRVKAIVFVRDPKQGTRPADDALRSLFGLTPAESRLAMLLSDGYSLAEISNLVGVSRNTLKSQLATIYTKTRTSRQSQLLRLLLQISSPSGGNHQTL